MSHKLRDRRLLAALAAIGVALLALRRRGDRAQPDGGDEPADIDPEDLPDVDDIDPEDLPDVDIPADVEADIEAVKAGETTAAELLDDDEFDIGTSDLAPPEDDQLRELVGAALGEDPDISAADVGDTIRERFETADVDEELLAEVRATTDFDLDGPSGGGSPDRETTEDADLDLVDSLAVLAAGVRGALGEYRRRTDEGGA